MTALPTVAEVPEPAFGRIYPYSQRRRILITGPYRADMGLLVWMAGLIDNDGQEQRFDYETQGTLGYPSHSFRGACRLAPATDEGLAQLIAADYGRRY